MGPRVSTQHLAVAIALVLALCLLSLSTSADRAQAVSTGILVPNQVIVKLKVGKKIGQINSDYGMRIEEPFLDDPSTSTFLLERKRELTVPSLLELVERLRNDPRLLFAEPNFSAEAPEDGALEGAGRHRAFPGGGAKPSPENYSSARYAPSALNLSDAHEVSRGENITVAVLDTGAQLGHPTLKHNFKGVARHDFVGNDKDPSEPPFARDKKRRKMEVVGHGTHVAGIVDLVAPEAKIMPLRVLNRKGRGNVFDIAQAIAFANSEGANVINLSLGTPGKALLGLELAPPRLLKEVIEDATDHGVVVVAAAGNSDDIVPNYPAAARSLPLLPELASTDGLMAVTSVDCEGKKSTWANYGLWVDIAAPGEDIRSAYPVSRYADWSGTSMATPFVAGEAALIQADDGSLDSEEVEERIRRYARSLALSDPRLLTVGLADVGASLKEPSLPGLEPPTCQDQGP